MFEEAEDAARDRLAQAIRAEIDALPAESRLRRHLDLLLRSFNRVLDPTRGPSGWSVGFSTGPETGPAEPPEGDPGEAALGEWLAPPPLPSLTLHRVVRGPPEVTDQARLVSVELWEDRVAVNLAHIASPPNTVSSRVRFAGASMRRDEAPRLTDDLGTRYRCDGSGTSESDGFEEVRATFKPAVPAEARSLEVAFGERRFSVPLELG